MTLTGGQGRTKKGALTMIGLSFSMVRIGCSLEMDDSELLLSRMNVTSQAREIQNATKWDCGL